MKYAAFAVSKNLLPHPISPESVSRRTQAVPSTGLYMAASSSGTDCKDAFVISEKGVFTQYFKKSMPDKRTQSIFTLR